MSDLVKKGITGMLVTYKAQIAAALPKHMTADRIARLALTEVRKNPKLQQCDPISILGAVIQSSQLGLEPGIQSYLVPYMNRKTGNYEAQMIPDYRGLMALVRRSGEITSFTANVVYAKDEFAYEYGTNAHLVHRPLNATARGEMIGAYAIAKFKNGDTQFDFMTKAEIDQIKGRSKTSGSGPWVTDYDAMARKTVVRRLCKMLPVSIEVQRAVQLEDVHDSDNSQNNAFIIDGELEEASYDSQAEAATSKTQDKIREQLSSKPEE